MFMPKRSSKRANTLNVLANPHKVSHRSMFLLIGKSQPRTDAQCNYNSSLFEIARVFVRLDHIATRHRKREHGVM
jgi:hypothetical protein